MEQNQQPTAAPATMNDFNALSMYFDGDTFATAQRVCLMLASSDLVPKEYQYKPIGITNADGTINPALKAQDDAARNKAMANCMIALNKAAQLKSDPLTIMQNMAIVYGRPSWSATFLIGTVNTCGRYAPLKFRFDTDGEVNETFTVYKKNGTGTQRTIHMPNTTCVAYTTERGSDEVLEGTMISIRLAFEEGWLQKDGSKWLTMPKQMLMYRAAAFWVRVYAPEISQGMHTTEEVRDTIDVPYEDVTDKVRRDIETPALPAPTFEAEPAAPAAEPVALPAAAPATKAEPAPAGQMQPNTAFDSQPAAHAPAPAAAAPQAAATQRRMPNF